MAVGRVEKELAHGVGGLGGGDESAHVTGDSGLYSGVTDRATAPTVVGEDLILFLSTSNFIKR
jgi:hypothetical protein